MRNRDIWSGMFISALGALIGTLIALHIAATYKFGNYLWILGALIGAFISACSVDPAEFRSGIVRAGRNSKRNFMNGMKKLPNWKPDPGYWKLFRKLYWWSFLANVATLSSLVLLIEVMVFATHLHPLTISGVGNTLGWMLVINAGLSVYDVVVQMRLSVMRLNIFNVQENAIAHSKKLALWANPVGLISLICYGMGKSLCLLALEAWKMFWLFLETVRQFFWDAFLYTHSERLKVVFVDTALGTVIGYFFGDPLIGAMAGAILHFIDYEIVSVRWLKLIPQATK